jgi:hypothetical protein
MQFFKENFESVKWAWNSSHILQVGNTHSLPTLSKFNNRFTLFFVGALFSVPFAGLCSCYDNTSVGLGLLFVVPFQMFISWKDYVGNGVSLHCLNII